MNFAREILSSPAILFWTLPYLMALLIVGTLAQGQIGLHESLGKYFQSFVFFAGFVPLPGGLTICIILFLNLLVKFIYESEWRWLKVGINLAHIGVLVLLIGGFLSFVTHKEGVLVIEKESFSSTANAYVETDFTITKNGEKFVVIPFDELEKDAQYSSVLPFQMTILESCSSCEIEKRANEDSQWRGPAKGMQLVEGKSKKRAEDNLQGVTFEISGASENHNGKYVSFTFLPKSPEIKVDGDTYQFMVERHRMELPFSVKLNKFEADYYPGTERAENYSSDVVVKDDVGEVETRITMNKPLRVSGYTLYQSSFFKVPDGEIMSVLAVVKNSGRLFPYLSLIIVGIGLLLHLVIAVMRRTKL